jgi:hypothetical protein
LKFGGMFIMIKIYFLKDHCYILKMRRSWNEVKIRFFKAIIALRENNKTFLGKKRPVTIFILGRVSWFCTYYNVIQVQDINSAFSLYIFLKVSLNTVLNYSNYFFIIILYKTEKHKINS